MATVGIYPRAGRMDSDHRGPRLVEERPQGPNRTVELQQATECPSADPELGIFGEEQRRVLCLLRALPAGQGRVAALVNDGLSCEEIAELTSKPQATIRSQLRQARKTLKEVMVSDSP